MTGLMLRTPDNLSGWVLVEAHLGSRFRYAFSSLKVQRSGGKAIEIPLSVLSDGRIVELVELPSDTGALAWRPPDNGRFEPSQITVRRVGPVERAVRMAVRVVRTCLRLSEEHRLESGLTFWRSLFDLAGRYRVATAFRVCYPLLNYADWIERFDALSERDVAAIRAHIARFDARPRFQVLLAAGAGGREAVLRTLASLRGQIYREFTCTVVDAAGSLDASFDAGPDARFVARPGLDAWLAELNAALDSERRDEWVMLLRAGDVLPAHALYWYACEAQARTGAAVIYSDDDALDAQGQRTGPRFKPDWSPAHLHSTHYVGAAAIFRGDAVATAGGVRPDCCQHGNYDLLLRVAGADAAGKQVAHAAAILLHRDSTPAGPGRWDDPQWCARALAAHFARSGIAAVVEQTAPGCRRVRYRLPEATPMVSIIVPTRDAVGLLRQCVDSVLAKTAYPRFEILVVDNQSVEPETLSYFERISALPNVRVLRYDHPFNYSRINNFAVREARGEMLCLLNNDVEVISPDWLDEMAGHLLQSRVGAVGAKLLYPDGRVQHVGAVVGPGGCANHLHMGIGRDAPGYCNRALVAQEFSAVTAACLLTWKRLYEQLGGLNETELTVAFNDVDYCLRLQDAGLRVVLTPHAELLHHESASRGRDDSLGKRLRARREVRYMRKRWAQRLRYDPYYNLNLNYWRPDFSLTETLRVKKPWLEGQV